MADNMDKKIEKMEKNCYETARNELKVLKEENDVTSNEKIFQMVENYKDELRQKFESELNRINREYNKNLFDYEMEERIKINKFKETLTNNIYNKIIKELQDFVKTEEYKAYLFNSINTVLNKFENRKNTCTIYLTENDYYKLKDKIYAEFDLNIEKIDNENIGGCIIVNNSEKISIDNTLRTNIQEKIKNISL